MTEPCPNGTWRDWVLVDFWRTNRTGLVPWVTLFLSVVITAGNWEIIQRGEVGQVWTLLANRFSSVYVGEWWRIATSWLPHMSMFHLWPDVVYLLVVGTIVERTLGRGWLLAVFFGANMFGGVCAFFLDGRYDVLCGSSDGTHALLITLCGILLRSPHLADRIFGQASIVWLGYHTIMGLTTGAMGWPFDEIANGGFDHLAALLVGGLGAVQASHQERARRAAMAEQGAMS